MNKYSLLLAGCLALSITASNKVDTTGLFSVQEVVTLKTTQSNLLKEVKELNQTHVELQQSVRELTTQNKDLKARFDSLQTAYQQLAEQGKADKTELSSTIDATNDKVEAAEALLSSRSLWGGVGIVLLILALMATVGFFAKRMKRGASSLDEVRKAQDALQLAQEKMQEERIQLDQKLVKLLSQQTASLAIGTPSGAVDHSLTLKVADEIVKIEMNLSRMDPSIKGYKQLSKGIERIKENFKANDYEVVDLLGKAYIPGMKVIATFVFDENLAPGQQIITRIIKPQVNYKQKMIQAAQIEVSQGE